MYGPTGISGYLIVSILVIIPFWRIFKKAGFHPALSILTVIPIVNLVVIYYVAFSEWAMDKKGN